MREGDAVSTRARDEGDRRAPKGPLWQRLLVGLLAALIAAIAWLPGWLAYALGDLLAVFWYLFWAVNDRGGRKSSGYWRNTKLAFRAGTQLDRPRPKRHLWRWSRHIAWILVDSCRMRRITKDNLHAHCELVDYEQVRALHEEGNGVIIASGHIGVWDVAGHVAGLLGLPITSVFRPSPLPALNRLIERLRTGSGQNVVARKKVMWTLKKALAQKEAIALLADGGGKHSAVVAPFLGVNSRTVATPALLHLATGAPIVVVAILRIGRMRYKLRVFDIIRDASTGDRDQDMVTITARVNRAVGRGIVEHPEQWFWHSRRYRHRPANEQLGADGLPPIIPPNAELAPMAASSRHRFSRPSRQPDA